MSQAKTEILVTADTSSARREVDALTKSVRETTTAADAAGQSQKGLARDVAQARDRQKEATAAVRAAKEALAEHKLTTDAFGTSSVQAAASAARLKAAQLEAARAASAANDQIEKAARAVKEVAEAEGKASPAAKRLAAQLQAMGGDAERTAGDLRRLDLQLKAIAEPGRLDRFKQAFAGSFAGNMAANAVGALTEKLREGAGWVLQTGASYETLRVALETTVGSSAKAATEFERLQRFAAATPYGVAEVTEAFIKLGNRGIAPTDRLLTSFGNTASAMGKTLDDYVEAVADAVTGENERLKEFGIVGKANGDKVAYTFKGVTTEVERSADAITEYLTRIGETNFAGGMERQSQTLAGLWSTMQDSAAALADEFMQGLAPALKDIMSSMNIADEDGKSLARTLGEELGQGVKFLADVAKELGETISGDNGTLAQFALLTGAAYKMGGAFGAAAAAGALIGRKLAESMMEVPPSFLEYMNRISRENAKREIDALEEDVRKTQAEINRSQAAGEKMEELTRRWTTAQEKRGRSKAEIEKAAAGFRQASRGENRMLGGGTEDDRLKEWEKQTSRLEKENEFNTLKQDKSLTPSEKKRLGELSKDLDIALPKKGKKGKKPPKDPTAHQRDSMDFDADVDLFTHKADQKRDKKAAEEQDKAFEKASRLQEARIEGIDREVEAIDAKGEAEQQQADFIFYQLEVETDAERQREALQRQRIDREIQLAEWQMQNARTEEQREVARTKLEAAEHKKRLRAIHHANAEEAKEQRAKVKLFNTLNNSMQAMGESLVTAIEAQAKGEKGAIAESVAEFAKGVRNKMILKAAEETALGVAAAAGIVTAGLAAPHFAAAAVAAGAAALAGGAQAAFHAAAKSQGYGAEKKEEKAAPAMDKSAPLPGKEKGFTGAERQSLEHQEVPVSFDDHRRSKAAPGPERPLRPLTIVFEGPVIGAGGTAEVGRQLRKIISDADQTGKDS